MSETVPPGSLDRRPMHALEQAQDGPAIEVMAKATRRRFTVEYKEPGGPGVHVHFHPASSA